MCYFGLTVSLENMKESKDVTADISMVNLLE